MRKTVTEKLLPKGGRVKELMEKYLSLGFSHDEADETGLRAGSSAPFAPVSFLPHIDYTISSVVGG